jgi:hypothetical protein
MKYLRISLVLTLAAIAAACYKDKGHYHYSPVPRLQLARALPDTSVTRGQHLTLTPVIEVALVDADPDDTGKTATFNPDDYTYSWKAHGKNVGTTPTVEVSTTLALDTTISLLASAEPYFMTYTVKEKATGVAHEFTFNLAVLGGRFSSAWLYLTEEDDATVDLMVRGVEAATGKVILDRGVLARSGFPYRGKGAKFIHCHYFNKTDPPRIFIGTGEATGYIDRDAFEWDNRKLTRFMMTTPGTRDHVFEKIVQRDVVHWIDTDGNIFPMAPGVPVIYPTINILPPSVTGAGYDTITLAPFVAGTNSARLVYDTKNKRMMLYKAMRAMLYYNHGLQMVPPGNRLADHRVYYMRHCSSVRSIVIARDLASGKYYRYLYSFANLQPNPEEILNGSLLEQARGFECDFTNGFLYTVIGGKLHAFRSNANGTGTLQEVRVTNRPGFTLDEITYLGREKDNDPVRPTHDLIVATHAGTRGSGKVLHLRPNPTEPLDLTIEVEVTGLDRVKGVTNF